VAEGSAVQEFVGLEFVGEEGGDDGEEEAGPAGADDGGAGEAGGGDLGGGGIGGRLRGGRSFWRCARLALADARGSVGGDGFDLGFYFGGLLVAFFGFALEGFEDDFVEADVDLDVLGGGGEAAGGEFAGEHLVEDDAEGVDVGSVVDFVGVGELFWGHVLGGAHDGFGGDGPRWVTGG